MIENLQFRMIDISSPKTVSWDLNCWNFVHISYIEVFFLWPIKIQNTSHSSRIEIISVKSASLHKMHFSNYFQLNQFVVDSFTGKRISGINYNGIKIERRKAINQTAFWTSDFLHSFAGRGELFYYFARMKSRDFNLLSFSLLDRRRSLDKLLASTCMIKGNCETWVGAQMDEFAINNHRAFNRVSLVLAC